MREGSRRLYPFETIFGERQLTKKRRADTERIDGRAYVVDKSRQGQFS
jgi:hypothetical protein